MNSALQCLSHTKFLTGYFIDTEHDFEQDLNLDNVLGSGGKLAKAFSKVIRHLWFGTSSSFSPWEFKDAVSNFAQQFRGYEQHDSQELMSFVLDGLHEDLNRVKVKPYSEELKFEGTPTEGEVANAFWTQHLSRNQSIIVDNMYGQYRSQVTCPKCKKTSLKFDPFLMLSVDIPPPIKRFEVCFVPSDLTQKPVEYSFPLDGDANIAVLREKLLDSLSGQTSALLFTEVDYYKVEEVLKDSSPVPESMYKRKCMALEVPQRTETGVTMIVNMMKNDTSYGYTRMMGFAHPRVMSLSPDLTLKEVHFAIFQFVRCLLRLTEYSQADDDEETEKMEVDEAEAAPTEERGAEELYTKLYEATYESQWSYSRKEAIYKVRLMNYNNQWNSKKGAYENCPYCNTTHYTNCSLPFTSVLLRDFLLEHDPARTLQLEVCFPSDLLVPDFYPEVTVQPSTSPGGEPKSSSWSGISLYECLDFTCKEKSLTAENMWFCGECKEHVLGSKKMTIFRLPRVLTIHLKRFKQGEYLAQKNEKLVEFPITGLDMSRYVQSDLLQETRFDLFAVNEHSGSLGFGHYTAHAKDKDGWCVYNDSHVTEGGEESYLVSSSAYVLFYEAKR